MHHPGRADGGTSGAKPVILVVDEDADVRQATVRLLEQAGFQVIAGQSAAEARELTGRHRPALVLLEVVLSDGNGVEVARELKSDPALAGVFVVLVSAMRTHPQEQADGLSKGLADGYITRPFSEVEFLARVDAFLRIREVQEALRESNARHQSILRASPDNITITDLAGRITSVSHVTLAMAGCEREDEIVGRLLTDFIAPADRDRAWANIALMFQGIMTGPGEYRGIRFDGSGFDLEANGEFIRDANGHPTGIVFVVRDVTGRKRAELALQDSEAKFRELFDSAPVAYHELDRDGVVRRVNQAECALLGHTADEMLGRSVLDFVAEADHPACRESMRRKISEEQPPAIVQRRFIGSDGHELWAEIHDIPVRDATGRVTGLRSALLDITVRKRVEEALAESELRFRTLTEDAPVAISMSREGRIVYANPAYLRMFGLGRADELNDCPTIERYAPQCREEVREQAGRRAQGLPAPREYESIGLRADGSQFPMLVAVNPMQFPAGPALVAFITDLTARKQAEEERLRLEHQFHQAQKMESVGRLAGGVAHDFNNLLTVINGYSRMMLAGLSAADPLRDGLEEIHKAGERAAGLTRQLLAFSRKQILEPRRLDVNRLVEEMRPMLERLVGEDVEVRVALRAKSGTVRADPHQLEQVVMNLVVNARDAMPGIGKLLLETANVDRGEDDTRLHAEARAGRYVMLAVSDTGVGMDLETRNHAFEPFFTTKATGKGTGLGLSMVQGIVAQSGGYVEVCSEKGQGATFKVYLPALAEAAADAGDPVVVPALRGKETVLVVEDQAEVRRYAVAVLKSHGYRAIPAESAGEALLLSQRERVDLVLTDVVMPNVSGRELADRLETLRPGVKVLFMSGYTKSVTVQRGILEEGAQFIQKPFSAEELAGKVRLVLGPPARAARILVADDEAGVRGFLRSALQNGGYEVIEAGNGKEALRQVRAGQVDLLITDLVMPEQEGIETIPALRREVPGLRIIAISGAFEGQFLRTAQLLGADATMPKPVDAERLLAKVAELLNAPRRSL